MAFDFSSSCSLLFYYVYNLEAGSSVEVSLGTEMFSNWLCKHDVLKPAIKGAVMFTGSLLEISVQLLSHYAHIQMLDIY